MPNYEPTPRRFSTLSVPQTPSRRNSFDDASRPSLAITDGPGFPPLASPLDLSTLLNRLHQTSQDINITEIVGEDVERGRSRQSTRHRRSATAWSHHDSTPIQVPSARKRENSASTGERIALWEERSRSQSKGRSKSRGRELAHTGSRISVVPEMPEIASALARLADKEDIEAEENEMKIEQQPAVVEQTVQGLEDLDHSNTQSTVSRREEEPKNNTVNDAAPDGAFSGHNHATRSEDTQSRAVGIRDSKDIRVSPVQQLHHRQKWADSMAYSPPPSPKTVAANPDNGIDVMHIERPQTPLATIPALLPTPDATPQQLVSEEEPPKPDFTAVGWEKPGDVQASLSSLPATNSKLRDPPNLIRGSTSLLRQQSDVSVSQDAWRISKYKPEFPLPGKPTVQTTLDHATLARAPFDGRPLQELPKSQLSRAAQAYRPPPESLTQQGPKSSPHKKSKSAKDGDWAIETPPSPTLTYHRAPDDYRPARHDRRQSRSCSSHQRNGAGAGAGGGRQTSNDVDLESGRSRHEWDTPPVIERAFHAASVSIFQSLAVPMGLYRGFRDNYYPPPERPDIIKAYPVRRRLPIRIFFPAHYDLTSPTLLPTLFTIHGGGFTVGYASDDDKWNRTFADTYTIMLISLNYSKAPWACFPAPLQDVEALYHAVLNDESLPIDRMRTALCGFDAGANLALALAQLPSVQTGRDPTPRLPPPAALAPSSPPSPTTTRPNKGKTKTDRREHLNRHKSIYFPTGGPSLLPQGYQPNSHPASSPYQPPPLKCHPPPSAVIPICGILDFTTSATEKSKTRPYKRSLRGPRGWGPGLDLMAKTLPSSAWSYIPYGHDTSDPLLSPSFARRKDLPPHVFVIGAELDCLAHESWRAACSWAGGGNDVVVPDGDVMVGRKSVSRWRGCLDDGADLDGHKFGWTVYHGQENNTGRGMSGEEDEDKIAGTTRWLLVPDVVHVFDSAPWRNKYLWGDEEARMDAEMKTIAYQREMAEWLWGTVWK